jgi:hypothetical protein
MCWLVQTVCPSSAKKAPCKSTSFTYVEDSRECIDYQEIKIQEQVQSLTVGSIPRSIVVVLENDLVDSCKVQGAPPPVLLLPRPPDHYTRPHSILRPVPPTFVPRYPGVRLVDLVPLC